MPSSTPSRPPTASCCATSGRSTSSRGCMRSPATAACRCCVRGGREPAPLGRARRPTGSRSRSSAARSCASCSRDVAELPFEQRAALLLAELGDLSHAQIATVLECEEARVKALVYRARSGLIARRDARALPCEQVREQLATLRGGALRRLELKHHLGACLGCRAYRAEIKRQRQLLGAALPVAPSLGLKASVLGAIGVGGGSAGGGGGALIAGALSSLGGASAAKTAVVVVAATGAMVGGEVAVERVVDAGGPAAAVAPSAQRQATLGVAGSGRARGRIERAATTIAAPESRTAAPGRSRGDQPVGHVKRATTGTTSAGRGRANGLARGRDGKPAQPGLGIGKRLAAPPGQAETRPGRAGAEPGSTKPGRGVAKAPPTATPVKHGRSAAPSPAGPSRGAQRGSSASPRPQDHPQSPVAAPGRSGSAPGQPHDVPARP